MPLPALSGILAILKLPVLPVEASTSRAGADLPAVRHSVTFEPATGFPASCTRPRRSRARLISGSADTARTTVAAPIQFILVISTPPNDDSRHPRRSGSGPRGGAGRLRVN